MKVLHLTTHLNIGGITSYLLNLCTGFKQLGIETAVATSGGNMIPVFEERGIDVIQIPIQTKSPLSPSLIRAGYQLKKIVPSQKWTLLHAHTRVCHCLAFGLSKILHVPYVTTFHGHYNYHLGRKLVPCLGNQTIAISNTVKDDLSTHYANYQTQINTVFHGIDTYRFSNASVLEESKKAFRAKYRLPPIPILGIVARLSQEKGHLKLLEVLRILMTRYRTPCQLLIIGEGKLKGEIIRKIRALNLTEVVKLIPSLQDTRTALSLIDIYVTVHAGPEGFGLSALEAMAMGKPVVISYEKGGAQDFIENNKSGYVLWHAEPQEVAEKIHFLLTQENLRKTMGNFNSSHVAQKFSLERMTQQTLNIYENAL